ncbi:GDSL-type esterase/lipase family protein [Acetivibrio straminisolvens]|nr:GDSL-type esterase/lipase family protein [Acetivibrio straminisolvens]
MRKRKLGFSVIIVITIISMFGCFLDLHISAAANEYKFDFGGGAVEPGYIGVSASMAYDKSRGYGFNTPWNMKNVSASGSGLTSDAVQFLTYGTKSDNTFNVDLSNGLYEVKVTLGNTSRASVAAEGVYQIINMTGNCATDKFQIPITDGQLNILVTEGKEGTPFTLSALEIKKISDIPVTNRTIYIGGDSTVCNYYPLDSSAQAGWGQMLHKFVDTNTFQIRNMASSGQFARGFRDDGQFEAIMKYLKPGDIFILQLGINDTNSKNSTTEAQFKEIMTDMVVKAKATGATVVLSTPQGRATDFNSSNVHDSQNRWYRRATIEVAREQGVRLVDLNVLSSAYFTSIGPQATLALYMPDDTLHPNRAGATQLARIVAEELSDLLKAPVATPISTPAPTPTPTPSSFVYGDVNGNGTVESTDCAWVKRYLLKQIDSFPNENGAKAADVNGNGTIDSTDYQLLKRFILKAINEFPVQKQKNEPVIYQAEDAVIYNAILETVNAGYTGSSYVNYHNEVGGYIEWNVNAPSSGSYALIFRYANGTTVNRPMQITVNGNIVKPSMDFISTGAWTSWSEAGVVAELNQGNNVIRATAIASDGGPNVDYLKVFLSSAFQPVSEDKITIYIASDSTAQSYGASYAPQAGWGQFLGQYFTSNVVIANRAIAGRSSKSFVDEGRLDSILNEIKPGDYLLIQFGHNDATISNPDRYAAPYTTYKEYLAKYVDGARQKGAIPVLITPVGRLNYKNNVFVNDFPDYCTAMKQVAAEKNVKLIDLMTKSLNYYTSIGYNETYKLFMVSVNNTDYTHFTEKGALQIARLVAEGVKEINLDISKYLKAN